MIVDEPTVGLDPRERLNFRNLLVDLAKERLIILSTHIVSEVEASASSLVILNKGKLRVHDAPETLIKTLNGKTWECQISSKELQEVKKNYLTGNYYIKNDGLAIRIVSSEKPDLDAKDVVPTLEDVYLYYTSFKEGSN